MKFIEKIDEYLNDTDYQIIIQEKRINIVNYNEIVNFSLEQIIIKCNTKVIIIDGNGLVISKLLDNEILVQGNINNIRITK